MSQNAADADGDRPSGSGPEPTLLPQVFTESDPGKLSELRHTLQTPLNQIIGFSELLIEEAEETGAESMVADLQKIRLAGRKLHLLIDERLGRVSLNTERTVELPYTPAASPASSHEPVPTPQAGVEDLKESKSASVRALRPARILVVDDQETNRQVLVRRLERYGYEVILAENGLQALDILLREPIDLVLLDIMMPELDGFDTLSFIQNSDSLRNIPVIMISALAEMDNVIRCIEIGAEDYLTKPFNATLLQARIRACLEKKRLRDAEIHYARVIERERQRSDELLHVILPNVIAREMRVTNRVIPRRYENVAIMFADIVGFTTYCATRQPEEVISLLQSLVEAFEDITVKYNMEKIKTIGDCFMSAAGLLQPVENPVLQAVRCGLEMHETIARVVPEWQLRIGVHYGPVVAGVVGHRQYLFDVWGDTVNTAQRIESSGTNGAINVSAEAWQQIEAFCQGVSRGFVPLKGKGTVEIFSIFPEMICAP